MLTKSVLCSPVYLVTAFYAKMLILHKKTVEIIYLQRSTSESRVENLKYLL